MLISLAQQCCTCSSCAQPEVCMSQRCGLELRHWGTHAPSSVVKRRWKLRAHLVQQYRVDQEWLSHALSEGRVPCTSHSLLRQMGSKQEKAAVLAGRIIYIQYIYKSCLDQAKFRCFKGWIQPPGYSAHTALNYSLFQHFVAEHVQQNFSPPLFSPPAQL